MTNWVDIAFVAFILLPFVYSGLHGVYLLYYLLVLRNKQPMPSPPLPNPLPKVLVQLPIYNERYAVRSLLEAVFALDYPHDCLYIQIIDDSNDVTTDEIRRIIAEQAPDSLNVKLLQRDDRQGYKAGALRYGLNHLPDPDIQFVALFDADFVPPPNFLQHLLPYFANEKVGFVQSRWGHRNEAFNMLTQAQTLTIDMQFMIEQATRSNLGLWMIFNGTGGIWRLECITDSGNWSDSTVTEDADLSIRAHQQGWRGWMLEHYEVPGEVPSTIRAYRQQQYRWAKGTTQTLRLRLRSIWTSKGNFLQKLMMTHQMTQYLPALAIVGLVLLTPFLAVRYATEAPPFSLFLSISGLVSIGMVLMGQVRLGKLTPRRLLYIPLWIFLGVGVSWSNATAVIDGLRNNGGEFKRTPKTLDRNDNRIEQVNAYRLEDSLWLEWFALAYVSIASIVLVVHYDNIGMVLPAFLYIISFGLVHGFDWFERMRRRGK